MNMLEQADNQYRNDLTAGSNQYREAELSDYKEQVKAKLKGLMELSKDPYYDKYLAQMMKDLESQAASPFQVDREADRSYRQYQERMGQVTAEEKRPKTHLEFKIGMHVFSLIGAVLVLTAFVIFCFNFLSGLGQGLCLYGAALAVVFVSEFLLYKKAEGISRVITGIGISALYIANVTNYLILHTINGTVALSVTLLIALTAVFISRKRALTAIKIYSLLICHICFLLIGGFETELDFLIAVIMLFIINIVYMFAQNQEKGRADCFIHLMISLIFTAILTGCAWAEHIHAVYLAFYVVTSFTFVSILSLKEGAKDQVLFSLGCIGNGFCIFLLFLIGNVGPGISFQPEAALFVHIASATLVLAVCGVMFLLWNKEDGRRWAQLYYGAAVVLLLGSFSGNHWEIIVSLLAVFFIVKLSAAHKEVMILDGVVAAWMGIMGLWLAGYWYCWLLAGALFLSVLGIRQAYFYHQIAVTVSLLLIWYSQCVYYHKEMGLDMGWFYPVSTGGLLILFLLFNHLPHLKDKGQLPYNIVNVVLMGVYCFGVWMCNNYIFSSLVMVIGMAAIIIMFRQRYKMAIPKKYLVLAGFMIYFILTGHYESPVIVSILLMAVAFGCVGTGFKSNDRIERICGLVLAAFVCLKLAIYDFQEVELMYRVIVCLIVGVAALMISFIYVQLEKKYTN